MTHNAHVKLDVPASAETFNEEEYLAANPDVARAVAKGHIKSGRWHFDAFGHKEGRCLRQSSAITPHRREKLKRLKPFLRHDLDYTEKNGKLDFLSDDLRELAAVEDTEAVSAHNYDPAVVKLIEKYKNGLLLDCGAGRRDAYFDNVVNLEIVDYDTTDVLGVGEELPFLDNTFDAVISVAVLEHVKDPFRCAREITRVLKPEGELFCVVPLLQPLHGYPHHYFNMTHEGLRSLFPDLKIESQDVLPSTGPVWSLTWIVERWAAELPEEVRDEFTSLRISDLLVRPETLLGKPWVRELPKKVQFELASATALFARKPSLSWRGRLREITRR